MADRETNLHPKNNTTVDLKPNIVSNNIPDKAVTLEKLDQSLQDTISTHSLQIAVNGSNITKNTADIAKNTADIAKNKADIAKNTSNIATNRENVNSILDIVDIADNKINADTLKNSIQGDDDVIVDVDLDEGNEKLGIHLSPEFQSKIAKNMADITKNTEDIEKNTSAISSLETRTKNLEDSKVNVNTGTFDPASDNPASQKSIAGEMAKPTLMSNIVDSHGNKRFAEGDGVNAEIEGITPLYNKWSLSGTHLMLVYAFKLDSGYSIPYSVLNYFNVPTWIYNKINILFGSSSIGDIEPHFTNLSNNQQADAVPIRVMKFNNSIRFMLNGSIGQAEYDRVVRIQYDLLIDSE